MSIQNIVYGYFAFGNQSEEIDRTLREKSFPASSIFYSPVPETFKTGMRYRIRMPAVFFYFSVKA